MTLSQSRINKSNIEYCLVQAFSCAGVVPAITFAAVFLQMHGYSNTRLGLVMALGNVAAFVLGPLLGSVVDRGSRLNIFSSIGLLLSLEIISVISFFFCDGPSVFLSVWYCVYMSCSLAIVPLYTQLSFVMQRRGGRINYGAARGTGSLAYVPMSAFTGSLCSKYGAKALSISSLILISLQAVLLTVIYIQCRNSDCNTQSSPEQADEKGSSLSEFIRKNSRFCVLMVGVSLLFFGGSMVTNYYINIIRSLGGGEAQLGGICAFTAIWEIPTMFLYDRLTRHIRCASSMRIAAVFFTVKLLAIALAGNIATLYMANILQALSYALFIPASVQYVSLCIPAKDSAKGQAVCNSMSSLGAIFASLIGGIMYDCFAVSTTVFISVGISLLGTVICLFTIESK